MKKKLLLLLTILLLLTGCKNTKYKGTVNVLNWTSYIPDSVIRGFEKEYNIKVNYGTYSSNEELLAKITSSKKGTYDLIFPSDYMVELMIKRNIIEKIDKEKLSNIKNINESFLKQPFDKNNEYSLPFLLATTTLVVNKDNIKEDITSYKQLLNPKYKNNIVLLEDQRIVIGAALQALGYSINDTDTNHLEEAYSFLIDLKKNVKAFDSDSPKTFFITDEVDIGVMWSAEAIIAREENPNIQIVYPKEGHAISTDNYTILKGSKNEDNAYLFINYLLQNDVSKKIIEEYPYNSPNKNIKNEINFNQIFRNGHYVENIGPNIKQYDKLWADIK